MENPHAERQAVLLERILKNTVDAFFASITLLPTDPTPSQNVPRWWWS